MQKLFSLICLCIVALAAQFAFVGLLLIELDRPTIGWLLGAQSLLFVVFAIFLAFEFRRVLALLDAQTPPSGEVVARIELRDDTIDVFAGSTLITVNEFGDPVVRHVIAGEHQLLVALLVADIATEITNGGDTQEELGVGA